jgi:hypothetical protein
MHDSIRRFLCAGCGSAILICTMCDRGQRYCPGACARTARTRSLREANHRYQRTPRGRRMSAERSRRHRDRRRVTDQGSPLVPVCAILPASATETQLGTPIRSSSVPPCDPVEEKTTGRVGATGRFGADAVQCSFCRRWREPLIRNAPLRRRSSAREFERKRRR